MCCDQREGREEDEDREYRMPAAWSRDGKPSAAPTTAQIQLGLSRTTECLSIHSENRGPMACSIYVPYPIGDRDVSIIEEVMGLYDEMVANRRHFHAYPEKSFEEVLTAAYIVRQLQSYGIDEIYQQIGVTGVVAMIRGLGGDGPTIGLRADMDALPVQAVPTTAPRAHARTRPRD